MIVKLLRKLLGIPSPSEEILAAFSENVVRRAFTYNYDENTIVTITKEN